MIVDLSLLENSYDYLQESYKYYIMADENGIHEEKRSSYNKKIKWKMAYVNLVQALELLIKEGLRNIAPILIYEDIDKKISSGARTVSGMKGIDRLLKCNEDLVVEENVVSFIKGCIEKRNNFMHYEVEIDSSEIKPSYCKLFEIYIKLHNELLPNVSEVFNIMLKEKYYLYENILVFASGYVVFRNQEMRLQDKNNFLKEMARNRYQNTFIDKEQNIYKRIPYGNEVSYDFETWNEYCPDCMAAIGEFHYDKCDIEICPKCRAQLLSCDCDLGIVEDK